MQSVLDGEFPQGSAPMSLGYLPKKRIADLGVYGDVLSWYYQGYDDGNYTQDREFHP